MARLNPEYNQCTKPLNIKNYNIDEFYLVEKFVENSLKMAFSRAFCKSNVNLIFASKKNEPKLRLKCFLKKEEMFLDFNLEEIIENSFLTNVDNVSNQNFLDFLTALEKMLKNFKKKAEK